MATMEELVASINADARLEADRIEQETQASLERINAETAQLLQAERERLYTEARLQEQAWLSRMEAKRLLDARQQALACKQALVDETFMAARAALERMPGEQRRRLMQLLWDRASAQLRIARVTTARQDAQFFRSKGVAVSATEGLGGFIAESQDRSVRIDMRFETLLDSVRERKMAEISAVLFDGWMRGDGQMQGNRPASQEKLQGKQAKHVSRAKVMAKW